MKLKKPHITHGPWHFPDDILQPHSVQSPVRVHLLPYTSSHDGEGASGGQHPSMATI